MTRGNAPENRTHAPLGDRKPTDLMVVLLLINLPTSIVMLGLIWSIVTHESRPRFYPATIPIMAQAGLAALVALAGLVSGRERFTCLIASGAALGLLGLPAMYALFQWPGGDDGGSLGWLFIVGGGCATSFVIALVTTVMGIMERSRRRRGPILPEPLPASARHDQESLAPAASEDVTSDVQRKPKRAHRWLWGVLVAAGLYLFWIIAGPISWTTTRSELHPGGIELRSIDYHELTPLFPLPFYHHVDDDHERILLVNGRVVMRTNTYTDLHPSPTGAYVAAEHHVQDGPIRIYATASPGFIELPVDESKNEFPGHYNTYPFRFIRWEDDSNFLVEVRGTYTKDTGQMLGYRELWQVQADSGKTNRIKRQEQPWNMKLKWED